MNYYPRKWLKALKELAEVPDKDFKLREVREEDLAVFFEQQLDPQAIYMAAFTAKDPNDRQAFMEKWSRILNDPTITTRTIEVDGKVAGHISKYEEGKPEVTYWLGQAFWGKKLATRALQAFLGELKVRPIYGRAASDNLASIQVLLKGGFVITGSERSFANGRGEEIEETLLVLE